MFHPLACSSLQDLSKSTEPMIHFASVVFISSAGTLLFNKNMTHLTVAETAHPRQQEQGEGRMYNPCWHTHSIYTTATIRQVQLSQISVADVTNASLHTAQSKTGRSHLFRWKILCHWVASHGRKQCLTLS